ncbi:hypothetical protein FHT92_001890 [Rhizobium sp. BK377]|nr:hypothetical protein [Rhizobium sp. BK377]
MSKVLRLVGVAIYYAAIVIFKTFAFIVKVISNEMRRSEKRQRERERRIARAENAELRRLRLNTARRNASETSA